MVLKLELVECYLEMLKMQQDFLMLDYKVVLVQTTNPIHFATFFKYFATY